MFPFAKPLLKPAILFTCAPEDEGVIAPPIPAKSYMPDWFRKLPATDPEVEADKNSGQTVKRCMPFLDAMTTGWIIPLVADLRLEISEDGAKVEAGWDFDRTLVSFHGRHQVAGPPMSPRPPMKFHNYWTITTPPGWSCLFVDPLNRPNGIFEIVAGVVNTDTYRSPINFRFFATGEDGLQVISKGAPLVQVIPFRRSDTYLPAEIRAENPVERAQSRKIFRNTLSGQGWYRRFARAERYNACPPNRPALQRAGLLTQTLQDMKRPPVRRAFVGFKLPLQINRRCRLNWTRSSTTSSSCCSTKSCCWSSTTSRHRHGRAFSWASWSGP